MMNEENIKIGRINRAEEVAMGISLSSDVSVYMKEEQLNSMASKRPDDYLKAIEEMSSLIKTPDYVRYDEANDSILFVKEYIKECRFRKAAILISQEGNPKKWVFKRLFTLSEDEAYHLNEEREFARLGR